MRCWGVQGGGTSPLVEAPQAPDLEGVEGAEGERLEELTFELVQDSRGAARPLNAHPAETEELGQGFDHALRDRTEITRREGGEVMQRNEKQEMVGALHAMMAKAN